MSEILTREQFEELSRDIYSYWRAGEPADNEHLIEEYIAATDALLDAHHAALERERVLAVDLDKYKAFLFEDAHEHAERIKEIAGGPLPLPTDKSWDVWCEALAITYLGREQQPDWHEWQDDEFAYVCSDCGNSIAPGVSFWADRANPRHDRCVSCHSLAAVATPQGQEVPS